MKHISRKSVLLLVLSASMISAQSFAAVTTLKQVQVSNGSQIDLLFDGKVGKSQARAEFFNDVIQISLNDVSVYPAKISSINGGPLVKIFAYQYAPKLVRCRLTVKGKAEEFKDRFQISSNGKVLSLHLADGAVKTDKISVQSSRPVSVAEGEETEKAPVKASADRARTIEVAKNETSAKDPAESALLDKIMRSSPSKPVAVVESKGEKSDEARSDRKSERASEKLALGGAKPLPSPMGVMAKLLGVIGLFAGLAFAAKRFIHKGAGIDRQLNARIARGAVSQNGWMSALGGMAKAAASNLGRKDKLIEVLSNHHLGPKKSIAVVRVMGKTLVLGVTNESINLISPIRENDSSDSNDSDDFEEGRDLDLGGILALAASKPAKAPTAKAGAPGAEPTAFSAMVQQEAKKPVQSGVRSQIRSRLEGLKQL